MGDGGGDDDNGGDFLYQAYIASPYIRLIAGPWVKFIPGSYSRPDVTRLLSISFYLSINSILVVRKIGFSQCLYISFLV